MSGITRRNVLRAAAAPALLAAPRAAAESAIRERHLLLGALTPSSLERSLIPRDRWTPFPVAADRDTWDKVAPEVKTAVLARANANLGQPYPPLPATLFLEYARTGNRSHFEGVQFARRDHLRQSVLAECVEGKARFLDDIADGIWATCEETFWGIPAHLATQKRRVSEFTGILRNSAVARYVAVCDLDNVRTADARQLIESAYAKKFGAGKYSALKTFGDYREMLEDKGIDAVCISTPDHWHAQPAMEAALAGKDIYLQKPASLTIREGRQMSDMLKHTGRILQLGSQQRSEIQFRYACELVRNGRIGKLQEIFIGLPVDPSGNDEPKMPVPSNLNYEMWLGSTPEVYYTEKRVHPQSSETNVRYDRPGWLRCEQFGAGMITGWGAHHIDIAHWAMNTEYSGPLELEASAEFPKKGLWDVHGAFNVKAQYANGVTVYISEKFPNGLKFIGEDGWIWVTRGPYTPGVRNNTLNASDLKILQSGIRDNEIHLHESPNHDHHLDWLSSVRTRKEPAAPAEVGHRSCSACLLAWAAMKLDRPLKWDPAKEEFPSDEEANGTLARKQRAPYGTDRVMPNKMSKRRTG